MSRTGPSLDILLFEPATLLRRTVSLTVRSLGTANVTEAATRFTARELLALRAFDGAVLAIDWQQPDDGMSLVQQIRDGKFACATDMTVAVLVESCNAGLLQSLMAHGISRILIKPFRARDVIDTIDGMRKRARAGAAQSTG